jgi:ribosomal-protein-serine acetyltransferase
MFERTVGPGLVLRLFQPADAEPLFQIVESQRPYLREWLPWVDRTLSASDARSFITQVAIPQETAGLGPHCGIWVDGVLAGSAGCHPIDWQNRSASLGYWLDEGHQGRGLVTRSVASMIDYLLDELDLHRIVIQCGTGNDRSRGVPARLGFTLEGILREAQWVNDRWVDLMVWRMLAGDWRNRSRTGSERGVL